MLRFFLPLCLMLLLVPQAQAQVNEEAENHYRTGYDLITKRNYRNAAIEFEKATAVDPNYGEAHYLLAQAYGVLNEYEQAINSYERARKLGVRPEKCVAALGKLYNKSAVTSLQQRKYSEAIVRFEQALELAPNNAQILYALGLSYNGNRSGEKAQEAF